MVQRIAVNGFVNGFLERINKRYKGYNGLVKGKTSLLIIASLLLLGGVACPKRATPTPEATLLGKSVLFIIAHKDFRDEEYLKPRQILEAKGANIFVASSSLEVARGMLGAEVKPDILLDEVNVGDYDAFIFVGGVGAREYWDDERAHEIARKAIEEGKILAAICIAPTTLARAGVLDGKRATAFPSEAKELKARGATFTGKAVERDGLIITAKGPEAAVSFGEEIARALE
jgi:protease I